MFGMRDGLSHTEEVPGMTQDRVAVIHVRWSGSEVGLGRYLPGANDEETVQALEDAGFKKTADVTEVGVTLDGDVEQRYYLPNADFAGAVKALRRAGFEVLDQDAADEYMEGQ